MKRAPQALAILAMVVPITTLSFGCGSKAPSGTDAGRRSEPARTNSAADARPTARDKGVRFAECVRAHGVSDFPDPNAKGEFAYGVSVSPAVFTKATSACKALEPAGALSSKRTPKEQSTSLRFAACIRKHGVKDFPDPVNGEPAINTYKIPSSNRPGGMTILNAAIDACKSIAGLGAGGQG